ncbi:MAG: SMP-30/gluconolactonase/LRE family protein [Chloroflexota bacterium]|nr:MAG: SMP-30/gluconolactonase/LRE family protein [Chloroflexota bacterium]
MDAYRSSNNEASSEQLSSTKNILTGFFIKRAEVIFQPNILALLSLSMAIVILLSTGWITPGAAKEGSEHVHVVRTFESDETGLGAPAGIAYSRGTGVFHIIESFHGEQPAPPETDIIQLTPFSERASSVRIAAMVQNPLNMVYDDFRDRLLVLQFPANILIEVVEGSDSNLNGASLIRHDIRPFGLQDPQGMAVDGESGRLFILDGVGPRILQVDAQPDGSFDGAVLNWLSLGAEGLNAGQGLGYDPSTGHLHVFDITDYQLYEFNQSGQLIGVRDLSQFGLIDPQGMVFAPSGDQTDDPGEMSLYLAYRGVPAQNGGNLRLQQNGVPDTPSPNVSAFGQIEGQILELSFTQLAAPAASSFSSVLIATTDMGASSFSPPSPDPSGLAYVNSRNSLVMCDGEVEETVSGITHFEGANVWEMTLRGSVLKTANISKIAPTVVPMSNEPTGVAWNPANGHFFFTDDGGKRVYELNPGADQQIGTSDDTWTRFDTLAAGSGDPEGIAFDTWRDRLFVADGVNMEIYEFTLNGTLVGHFDVETFGVVDPESVEFNSDRGTLFIMSSNRNSPVIVETDINGTLLQTIDISTLSARAAAGLAYAPASDGSGVKRFYIVDRGIDNNTDPNIVDGKMYEVTAPSSEPPTATPTPVVTDTPTTTPSPSPTPTTTPTPTPGSQDQPILVSFSNSGNYTIGGVAGVKDEDILYFNGTSWSMYFDGSDVGIGGVDLDAFHLLDADTLLLSVDKALSLGALGNIDDFDILQFDATSLGSTTAGSFSLYFDGSDVGLDSSGEDIDALGLLPDGRLIISTNGNPVLPGVSGKDEDLIVFQPTSLGSNTSGNWAMFFDGSDVGLSTSSSEDVEGTSITTNGDIFLNTRGLFSVDNVSGDNEDVFICIPVSLGDNTVCNFSPTLYFDGSLYNLVAYDVDAIHIP